MRNTLRADIYRMFSGRWLRLCAASMAALAAVMALIQYSGMEYTVSIDRVIFLPMAFYGIAGAALISIFTGEDFGDGAMRNKLASGGDRGAVYMAGLVTAWAACAAVYLLTMLVSVVMGLSLFETNVTAGKIAGYLLLGLLTCFAYGSIFYMLSMLCGNRVVGITVSMLLAFGMLFLCLHTNMVLVQEQYKNGTLNPTYVSGFKRTVYEFLHDLNPSGQAAQLSAMTCLSVLRFVLTDLLWVIVSAVLGKRLFRRMDVR